MEPIETLLIHHGVDPMLVDDREKTNLRNLLDEAKRGDARSFSLFADSLVANAEQISRKLDKHAEQLLGLLDEASLTVQKLVKHYPSTGLVFHDSIDKKALTEGHLSMLSAIEEQTLRVSALSAATSAVQTTLDSVELTLRRIALAESRVHGALCRRYNVLSESLTVFCDAAEQSRSELTALCNQCYEQLSLLAVRTSETVTAINKSKRPQTEYFNLLQTTLLQYHALIQTARQIQKEVPHVQISDVL